MSRTGLHDDRTERTDAVSDRPTPPPEWALRAGTALLGLVGLLFVVQGFASAYRTYVQGDFETGVDTLDGMTAAELSAAYPEVADYVAHLHLSFAGLVVAAGLAILALAYFGIRRRQRWALATALVVPIGLGVAMVPVHGAVRFDFETLVHLGPVLVGTVLVVAGGVLSGLGMAGDPPER